MLFAGKAIEFESMNLGGVLLTKTYFRDPGVSLPGLAVPLVPSG
jgi:hypothetical protein